MDYNQMLRTTIGTVLPFPERNDEPQQPADNQDEIEAAIKQAEGDKALALLAFGNTPEEPDAILNAGEVLETFYEYVRAVAKCKADKSNQAFKNNLFELTVKLYDATEEAITDYHEV